VAPDITPEEEEKRDEMEQVHEGEDRAEERLVFESSSSSIPAKEKVTRLESPKEGSAPKAAKREHWNWFIVRHYHLPRKVVVKSLEVLDAKDSPDRPGMMYEKTLRVMVSRFDNTFVPGRSELVSQQREAAIEVIMEHLQKHTRRRRGDAVLSDGFLEWEKTSRVYDLFTVDLNMLERIFFTVDVGETTSILSQFTSLFLISMIVFSIAMWMVSTLPEVNSIPSGCNPCVCTHSDCSDCQDCAPEPAEIFKIFEHISVYVFTLEYLVRVVTVHSVRFALLDEAFVLKVLTGISDREKLMVSRSMTASREPSDSAGSFASLRLDGGFYTTMKYILKLSNLIDLFAILPFYLEVISGGQNGGALMVLRVLRLTRIFRVFKLGKYNDVFNLFSRVVVKSAPALSLMLFFISLGCCLFGTLIWFTEQGKWYAEGTSELLALGITGRGAYLRKDGTVANDLEESPFYSIIHSFWYVIVTVTTVGYGDLFPTTPLGKFVGSLTILNGIIVLAMPIGVVGTNFSSEYYKVVEEKKHRTRLKQQLDTLAAAEEEQDAALTEVDDEEAAEGSKGKPALAVEIKRIYDARNDIMKNAESMDSEWQAHLGPTLAYQQLSGSLIKFIEAFIIATAKAAGPIASRPVISIARLHDLDNLGSQVHSAIAAAMSVEAEAKFGVEEAHKCRQSWAAFEDRCWDYAIELCRVENLLEPPEFFEIKSHLLRSTVFIPPVSLDNRLADEMKPGEG
jgi:hypothetical protein